MISTNITQATSLPFPRKYNAVLAGSIMAALTKSLAKMGKFFWANFVLIVSNQNFCACIFMHTYNNNSFIWHKLRIERVGFQFNEMEIALLDLHQGL